MTDLDKSILHAWSAVRVAGAAGSPLEVSRELTRRGVAVTLFDLGKRMNALTAMGQVPS